jgi:hypothetical protein
MEELYHSTAAAQSSVHAINSPAAPLPVLTGPILAFVFDYVLRFALRLDDRDRRALLAAGFDERSLTALRYRSAPDDKIVRLVIEHEMNQTHQCGALFRLGEGVRVPGLFFDGSGMRFNLRAGRLLVPVKNARARLVSMQVYRKATDPLPQWFDSAGLPRGAKAPRAAHFARPHLARETGGIVIAEHTLAADLHAWRNDEATVALNDLLPWVFARSLRESLPEVGLVAFAFPYPDAELLRALHHYNFEVHDSARQEAA